MVQYSYLLDEKFYFNLQSLEDEITSQNFMHSGSIDTGVAETFSIFDPQILSNKKCNRLYQFPAHGLVFTNAQESILIFFITVIWKLEKRSIRKEKKWTVFLLFFKKTSTNLNIITLPELRTKFYLFSRICTIKSRDFMEKEGYTSSAQLP